MVEESGRIEAVRKEEKKRKRKEVWYGEIRRILDYCLSGAFTLKATLVTPQRFT